MALAHRSSIVTGKGPGPKPRSPGLEAATQEGLANLTFECYLQLADSSMSQELMKEQVPVLLSWADGIVSLWRCVAEAHWASGE